MDKGRKPPKGLLANAKTHRLMLCCLEAISCDVQPFHSATGLFFKILRSEDKHFRLSEGANAARLRN